MQPVSVAGVHYGDIWCLGDEALELLHILSKHSKDEYSERQFLSHAFRRLSVTLQRANANIQSRGMHIMQMGDSTGLLAIRQPSPFRLSLGAGSIRRPHSTPRHYTPASLSLPAVSTPPTRNLRHVGARRRLFVDVAASSTSAPRGSVHDDGHRDNDDAVAFDITFDHAASMCHADYDAVGTLAARADDDGRRLWEVNGTLSAAA